MDYWNDPVLRPDLIHFILDHPSDFLHLMIQNATITRVISEHPYSLPSKPGLHRTQQGERQPQQSTHDTAPDDEPAQMLLYHLLYDCLDLLRRQLLQAAIDQVLDPGQDRLTVADGTNFFA